MAILPKGGNTISQRNKIRIRSLSDLVALEPPSWLVKEYLPNQALVTLYGAPGCGKSFLALDLAMSVTTASEWLDRDAESGGAIYIACEAIAGLPRRVAAWSKHRGVSLDTDNVPFHFTTEFNELITPTSTIDLIEAAQRDIPNKKIKVIILDTLSRTLGGMDENSAGEMNKALNNLEAIRNTFGATVVVIHHTSKYGDLERGSTVLRGACDTMLHLKRDGGTGGLKLEMTKQRDWEEAPPTQLYFKKVDDSAVLSMHKPEDAPAMTAKDMESYAILLNLFIGEPVSYASWRDAANLDELTFKRIIRTLCEQGLVVRTSGKRPMYVPTSSLK